MSASDADLIQALIMEGRGLTRERTIGFLASVARISREQAEATVQRWIESSYLVEISTDDTLKILKIGPKKPWDGGPS